MRTKDEVVGWNGVVVTQRDEGTKQHIISLRTNHCEQDRPQFMQIVTQCRRPDSSFKCAVPHVFVSRLRSVRYPRPTCRRREDLPFPPSLYTGRHSKESFVINSDCMKLHYHVQTDRDTELFWTEMQVAFVSPLLVGKTQW